MYVDHGGGAKPALGQTEDIRFFDHGVRHGGRSSCCGEEQVGEDPTESQIT